jgi:hypothetical protein
MKYTSVLLFVAFGLGCLTSVAQSTYKTKRISLKLYSQITAHKIGLGNRLSLGIAPAISLATKNGHFKELELNDFSFSKKKENLFPGVTIQTIKNQLEVRYSFNYSINKIGKFKAYMGAGFTSYYVNNTSTYENLNISDETSFAKNIDRTIGVDLNITPRLIWNFSERLFLDINIPINVFNTERGTFTVGYDSGMQVNEIKTSTFPNKYTVNVGLGFKL